MPHLYVRDSFALPPCRADDHWQGRCLADCGAAEVLCAGRILGGFPKQSSTRLSLHYLSAPLHNQRSKDSLQLLSYLVGYTV